MAVIESAWESHPGYRIDLVPYPGVARVWHGDLLLAESTAALRVIETDHVERLYFPESDVRLDLFAGNDHRTICPFKGRTTPAPSGPIRFPSGAISPICSGSLTRRRVGRTGSSPRVITSARATSSRAVSSWPSPSWRPRRRYRASG
jgi:hypothetical protein